MHKIQEKEFTLDDFSCEYLVSESIANLEDTIKLLNKFRAYYNEYDVKKHFYIDNDSQIVDKKVIWEQMIQLLPSSYNQTRNVMLNYEVLANIYKSRKNHKLDEWVEFCKWIETLPYSELITCDSKKANQKTGKWILMDDTYTRFKCSSCEINNIPMTYNYCPYCGCEMER